MPRTRALPPMPAPPQSDALPRLQTPLVLRAEDVAHIPEEQRAELPIAQAAWLRRQNTLDPRTPRYSRQITLDELALAHRIITSLFRTDETPGLTVPAAQDWMSALYIAIATAEAEGRSPTVALPYLWVSPAKMDVLEAMDRAEAFTPIRRRIRQRGNRTSQTELQTERQRHGRTRTHGSQTSDDSAPHVATERDAAQAEQADASERGQRTTGNTGNKGGRQPRRVAGVAV